MLDYKVSVCDFFTLYRLVTEHNYYNYYLPRMNMGDNRPTLRLFAGLFY